MFRVSAPTLEPDGLSRRHFAMAQAEQEEARRVVKGIAKLKKAIKPGSVLIMLGGRFRGKRVVFLKQLPSGLLLVTGPYQLNGVPLRRVNQAYCIGTSASVDIKGVDVSKVDDAFFARTKKPKAKKDDEFFAGEDEVRTSARPLPRPTRGPRRDTRE